MPKLYALNQIILADDKVVLRGAVFDATVAQAKQFDALKSARPATGDEIKHAADLKALEDGTAYGEAPAEAVAEPLGEIPANPEGDPKGAPKGKSA